MIRHIGITVYNLQRAVKFYSDLLNPCKIETREEEGEVLDLISDIKNIKLTSVKLKFGDGNILELLHYNESEIPGINKALNGIGISHIAITVENLDNLYRELLKQNIIFNAPPQIKGNVKITFCRDYEGNLIELVEELKNG